MSNALTYALGTSAFMAAAGAIGGATLQTVNASVSVAAHATMLGSWPLIGFSVFAMMRANRVDEAASAIFGIMGGYLSAYALTNMMGLHVSIWAPVFGIGSAALVITPFALCVLGIAVMAR